MTENQLKTVVGLIAGMQTAIVHLANVVADHAQISHEDLAVSFERTGEAIPLEVQNRELLRVALKQVARGIRNAGESPECVQEIARLLH